MGIWGDVNSYLLHCRRHSAWASQPESYEELIKALIAAQLPDCVSHAEIVEWLPDVDYRPVHDRVVNDVGLGPALSTLIAMAATHLGKHRASMFQCQASNDMVQNCSERSGTVLTQPNELIQKSTQSTQTKRTTCFFLGM